MNKKTKTSSPKKDYTPTKPAVVVIFGATGDLCIRKLIPSFFSLYKKGMLPENFRIIAFSRRPMTDQAYHSFIQEEPRRRNLPVIRDPEFKKFLKIVSYQEGLFDDPQSYRNLKKKLVSMDKGVFRRCSNKLFYLAVPPDLYQPILKNLSYYGLTIACSDGDGWTRILIEKPFGRDDTTAKKLDLMLGKLFREEQIFRIDHYLAKETLQNILMFRFSNVLFEPIWNSRFIDRVEMKIHEKIDVEGRGAFYDNVGALRDVGQNHMLRMLALIAMENPRSLAPDAIRLERFKVMKALQPIKGKDVRKFTARGQYRGYRDEPDVAKNSSTETWFRIKARINNKRWKGVPFYLESGKAMKESKAEIRVYLKESSSYLCPHDATCNFQNVITFNIQPEEGISVRFWAKKPGLVTDLEPRELSFYYNEHAAKQKTVDAYERVLFDCIKGDQSFFTSTDEVLASWKFVTPIIEAWKKEKIHEYAKGTFGPVVGI
jgi:glucose-6-phosphate 1-dehydrogenase